MKLRRYLPCVPSILGGRRCMSNFKWDSNPLVNLSQGFPLSLMQYIKSSTFVSLICKNEPNSLFLNAKPTSCAVCSEAGKAVPFPQLPRTKILEPFFIPAFPSFLTSKPSANPVNCTSNVSLESNHFSCLCW